MNEEALSVLNVVCFILMLGAAFMVACQRDDLKREAVERGFAEWVSDSSGNTTWQWREVTK